MINPIYEKFAKLAINYAVNIQKGDRVFIAGPALAQELFQALLVEVIKSGGHPLILPAMEGSQELRYKYASEEQLTYIDPIQKTIIEEFDSYIIIAGDYNTRKMSLVDPKLLAMSQGSASSRELWEILSRRMGTKELKYLLLPFPCHALAQEASMDLFSYTEFVTKAMHLDKEDPIKEWLKVEKEQDIICEKLKNVEKIQIIGENTDLTMSVKGRLWVNECGHDNLPDGEVLSAPIEDSVNGYIQFSYPGIFQGKEIEKIYLEFKDGRVIKSSAEKGEELLQELIKIENADILGEFAIGTNYGITKFTKNMLFDEKMGGTIHCALGSGIKEAGSKNDSGIHWDIIKDMNPPGSKILADGKVIYEEGKWKI